MKKAIKHGELTYKGETASKINYQYDGIIDAVKWLYQNNELIRLNKFYKSSYLNVRSWTASFLLEIDTKNAEKVLDNLVELNYSNAEYILMEWKEGTLDMNFYKG